MTYTIAAPSGTWGASPQGTYTVSLVGGQVKDLAGNAMAANSSLATFLVDMVAPTASVTTAPPTITAAAAGSITTTLTVTYADSSSGVNPASFSIANLAVTNGATVTAYSTNGNAVTYTIAAPSGTWGGSTQGTYTVSLLANQVKDLAGNAVAANASLATFLVDTVPPTASVTTAPPTITTAGDSSTTLTVTYADSGSGINTATFATTNLAVTNGATVSAYSASGDAVTYTITAPSGTWGGSPQGTYTVSLVANQVQDLAGNAAAANASLATFVVNAISDVPPQVMGVYLSGSTWSSDYFNTLLAAGVGSATLGFELAAGGGQLANANICGSVNANQVTIVFSEPVNIAGGSFVLADSSNHGGPASGISVVGQPVLDAGNTAATWTLSGPLTSNKYYAALAAAGVTDAAGTQLSGGWTTGQTTYGNGAAGGNFNFEFYFLAGDVNGDGKVTMSDFNLIRSNVSLSINTADWRYDVNGDGRITMADANASRSRAGAILSNFPEPVAPLSNTVPGGGPLGDSDSAAAPAAGPAVTTSALATAAATIAVAAPAAAVRGSSAAPSASVAIAPPSFDSTRIVASPAAAAKASPPPVSAGPLSRTAPAGKIGSAMHVIAVVVPPPMATVVGLSSKAAPASVPSTPQSPAGAGCLNAPPVVRPVDSAVEATVRDAVLAAFSAWLPAAETGEIKQDLPLGRPRPASQAKAAWTTLIDLALPSTDDEQRPNSCGEP